eukprot:ANDGO_04200.mRNA.1 hypothetical protein AMSG_00053
MEVASGHLSATADKVKEKTSTITDKLDSYAAEKKQFFKTYMQKKKEKWYGKALRVVDRTVEKSVDKVMKLVKMNVIDEDMPKFVQRTVGCVVDDITPDIKIEATGAVRGKLTRDAQCERFDRIYDNDNQRLTQLKKRCCCGCGTRFRGWFLYTMYPFDLSFWLQIRKFWFWLIKVICLLPFVGVQQAMFFFIFFMKDRTDEYQLIQYVLDFRGFQCITLGFIGVIVGAAQYYACANRQNDNGDSTCNEKDQGPGQNDFIYVECAFFLVQIFFTWAAFFLLPYSKKKGGFAHRQDAVDAGLASSQAALVEGDEVYYLQEQPVGKGCFGRDKYAHRGGRMAPLIIYDACLFLLCILLLTLSAFARPTRIDERNDWSHKEWVFKADLYWAKTLFGLLSFPFLVFKLPVLGSLLTHARPTAYTKLGKCVPVMPAPIRKSNRAKAQKQLEQIEKKKIRPSFAKFKRIFRDSSDDDGDDGSDGRGDTSSSSSDEESNFGRNRSPSRKGSIDKNAVQSQFSKPPSSLSPLSMSRDPAANPYAVSSPSDTNIILNPLSPRRSGHVSPVSPLQPSPATSKVAPEDNPYT